MRSELVVDRSVQRDALDQVQVHIGLRGLVDLGTQPVLEEALDRALAEPGVAEIVVDLAELTMLDSTGIATLLAAYRTGRAGGVAVRVVNPAGMVRRVLEITGVLKTLEA
ncbi:STAS domain-containing protein [Dactylosporangium sp. CA-139066]|uniref:STAS domain-containing protein n=1 Tax=Dactylosporangium sp. CA-139066 TaxID=3239930 RepID=UPI003D93C7B1